MVSAAGILLLEVGPLYQAGDQLNKRIVAVLLSFLVFVTCIAALPTASASHVEVVVPAGGQYEISVQLNQGSTFVFGWSSTHALTEVFRDPNGSIIKSEVLTSSGGTAYVVPTTGLYTMTWTNAQLTSATLKVDYFPNVNGVIDAWIAIMIIGLVIVVVVVIVIVVVVMHKPRVPPQAPQQYYQQPPPPPPPSK